MHLFTNISFHSAIMMINHLYRNKTKTSFFIELLRALSIHRILFHIYKQNCVQKCNVKASFDWRAWINCVPAWDIKANSRIHYSQHPFKNILQTWWRCSDDNNKYKITYKWETIQNRKILYCSSEWFCLILNISTILPKKKKGQNDLSYWSENLSNDSHEIKLNSLKTYRQLCHKGRQ